jgi:hypothetical protein
METRQVSIKMFRKGILNLGDRGLVGRGRSIRRGFGLVFLVTRYSRMFYSLINSSWI